jgi:hypothetical protein
MKKAILIIVIIIFVTNIPFFRFYFEDDFIYENIDGSFSYNEQSGKGGSFLGCLRSYGHFLCEHPDKDQGDNRLYRTFAIKPWRFWEWSEMLFSERYRLPYKQPN